LVLTQPPTSTLFPYPTLFRSRQRHPGHQDQHECVDEPRDPEVRVDTDERGEKGAGKGGQPGPQAEGHEPHERGVDPQRLRFVTLDRKSTRLNSSHVAISYAVF